MWYNYLFLNKLIFILSIHKHSHKIIRKKQNHSEYTMTSTENIINEMQNYGTSEYYAWIDLETTDLDHTKGTILEIALIITTALDLRECERHHIIVSHPESVFDQMSEWCQTYHRRPRQKANGLSLIDMCRKSTIDISKAECILGSVLDRFRGGKWILLAGSSIRLDYMFLMHHMPTMKDKFHYRQCDVSSVMEFGKRFYPHIKLPPNQHMTTHCAMDDIEMSLNLMRWIRCTYFVYPPKYMLSDIAKTHMYGFNTYRNVATHTVPVRRSNMHTNDRTYNNRSRKKDFIYTFEQRIKEHTNNAHKNLQKK